MSKYLPSPTRLVQIATAWALTSGVWWATSITAHVVVLSTVVLLLGKITAPPKEGDAPAFEARLDDASAAPIDHFEVGQTPLEPTELNTETLSIVDAPQIDAAAPSGEPSDALAGAAGSSGGGGFGGLDQFAVKSLGPGPLVRGGGAGTTGLGRGLGGAGNGFGARGDKDARKAMIGGYGGTKASERAVAAALNWFARHQSPDGRWSLGEYPELCKGDRCTGVGNAKSDVAATAMALLPFLAAGQTHQSKGPYQRTIDQGLAWLINRQQPNGDLRDGGTTSMYTQGLAAITLCEAYALSKDSRIRLPAQQAIAFIEAAQNSNTGGWHYKPGGDPPTFGDTSIVGWQVMALKSAQMAGLTVTPAAIDGSHKWLRSSAKGQGGTFSYWPTQPASMTMTAVGLLCTQYLGAQRQDPGIQEGLAFLMTHLPANETRNSYYWYYGTQVMHNLPGPEWDTWNRQMRRVLIDSQVKEGCAAGSWDPEKPTPDPQYGQGGRIMVTSFCCLTLEVYYRYLPLYKIDAPDKAGGKQQAAAGSKSKSGKP